MGEYKKINEIEIFTQTLPDGSETLLAPFTYRGIHIPAGFNFDGASSPRIFWSIIPPFKQTKRASCVHDYLCRNAKNKEERARADKIFKEALIEMGLNPVRVTAGYWGVRIGAFFGVGNHF